jgi:hypothetical protein
VWTHGNLLARPALGLDAVTRATTKFLQLRTKRCPAIAIGRPLRRLLIHQVAFGRLNITQERAA